MASWYKNILTNTTSQLSSLQSRLLQTENDGDTEDDTHVCRVLRAYYTQEQRPFPGWLPPDPKAPPPGSTSAPAPAAAGGGSAQDRLKQRLWGGGARTTSPAGSQGPYQPPSSGGGSHGGDYEERFAPGGQYDGRGGSDKSYTGSNTPWSNNEPAYGGGGGGRPAQGLPSGPRRQGLPSGPRMRCLYQRYTARQAWARTATVKKSSRSVDLLLLG
ncbi:hypothetical protein HYQ44_004491 [Verticillium longisporum]|nr:hypothetical protein HYQ44_004491 [Verticillium longisporum]